eukprot:TRINITY_DN5443_c0_g3_i1.p1 TRINITY_DN5443_c0_g3~~TRINITY_DN5443_c0_g3_i1.p1  ORF type:complete len:910 (-),score=166.69 TRINITY_DN5443_c0_g3_i1:101-2776(-)
MFRRLSARLLDSPEFSDDDEEAAPVAVHDVCRHRQQRFRTAALCVLVVLRFRSAGRRRASVISKRRLDMALSKKMDEDEAAFHQRALNSPGLMNRTVEFVRQLVESSLSEEAMNVTVGILHKLKVATLRCCWKQYLAPMNDMMAKDKKEYAMLKSKFQENRCSYLKEISALRDSTRKRANPLDGLDTTVFYGPENMTASQEEMEYLQAAVVEMVKVVFDTNPSVQKTIDASQLERLRDCATTEATEVLQQELKKAQEEIRELRAAAVGQDIDKGRSQLWRRRSEFDDLESTKGTKLRLKKAEECISVQGEKLRERTAQCQDLETRLKHCEDQKNENERELTKYKSALQQLHVEKDLLQQSSNHIQEELRNKLKMAEIELRTVRASTSYSDNHSKNDLVETALDLPDRPPPKGEIPPEEASHDRVAELQLQCRQLEEQQRQLQELLRQHLQTTLSQSAEEAVDDADNLLRYTSLLGGFPADDTSGSEIVCQQAIQALTSELQEVNSYLGDARDALRSFLTDSNMANTEKTEKLLILDKHCAQHLQTKRCVEAKLLIARLHESTQVAVTSSRKFADHPCKECPKMRQELEATQALLVKVQEVSSELAKKLKRSTGKCLEQSHRIVCNQSMATAAQSLVSSKLFQQAEEQPANAEPKLRPCVQPHEPTEQATNKMNPRQKRQSLFGNINPRPLSQQQCVTFVVRPGGGNAETECEPSELDHMPGEPLAGEEKGTTLPDLHANHRISLFTPSSDGDSQSEEKQLPTAPRPAKQLLVNMLNRRGVAITQPASESPRKFSKGTSRRILLQDPAPPTQSSSKASGSLQAVASPGVTSQGAPASPIAAASPRGSLEESRHVAAAGGNTDTSKCFYSMNGEQIVHRRSPSNLASIRLQSI